MTDRDHFAAAALTGLLSNVQRYQNEPLTRQAFEIADFMLRERCRAGGDCPGQDNTPNLDAAPAARASEATASPERVRVRGDAGTGDTQEPAAWIVRTDHFQCGVAEHYETAVRWAEKAAGYIVPLYRKPQPTLTDAEREAVRYMIAAGKFGQRDEALTEEHAATLRGLLERLGGAR